MGTLLTFQPSAHPVRPALPPAEMGKLLLFTGVRYERIEGTDRPDGSPHGGRKAKARRRD